MKLDRISHPSNDVILNAVKSLPCKGSLYSPKIATLYTITKVAIGFVRDLQCPFYGATPLVASGS